MIQVIILGMLELQPMSGYDIQVGLQDLKVEMWGGVAVGSIYHALKKLERDEYIEIDSIKQTGLRQKATYKITEKGSVYLKKLIIESLTKSSADFPTDFYSAMAFIDKVPKDEVKKALEEQLKILQSNCEELDKGLSEKNKVFHNNLPPIVTCTFENMYGVLRLQIEYIEKLLTFI